jgi:hypothetical protein
MPWRPWGVKKEALSQNPWLVITTKMPACGISFNGLSCEQIGCGEIEENITYGL